MSLSRGSSRSTLRRLCSRAPRIVMVSATRPMIPGGPLDRTDVRGARFERGLTSDRWSRCSTRPGRRSVFSPARERVDGVGPGTPGSGIPTTARTSNASSNSSRVTGDSTICTLRPCCTSSNASAAMTSHAVTLSRRSTTVRPFGSPRAAVRSARTRTVLGCWGRRGSRSPVRRLPGRARIVLTHSAASRTTTAPRVSVRPHETSDIRVRANSRMA